MRVFIYVFAILFSTTACVVGPNYKKPQFEVDDWIDPSPLKSAEPSSNQGDTDQSGTDKKKEQNSGETQNQTTATELTKWWQRFNDPLLDDLVTMAAMQNLDIAIAKERILEARARSRSVSAQLWPSFGAEAGVNRLKQDAQSLGVSVENNAPTSIIQNNYSLGLDAIWELDVFGGKRRAIEATNARLQSIEASYQHITLVVMAETARNYVTLRGTQERINLLKRNAQIQQKTVDLVTASYNSGLSREIDVTRATSLLMNTQALIPNLEAEMRIGAYRLAVLTGQRPSALYQKLETHRKIRIKNHLPPLGMKSDLLRRRPDIQAAERALAAAHADIGVSIAALYPSFNLTAGLGFSSTNTSDVFDQGKGFSLSSIIRLPIFESGRLRANIKSASARNSIAAIDYEKTVLNALEETERTLIRYRKELETQSRLQKAVNASNRSAILAQSLYEQGLTDFLDVLNAERALTTTQDALAQSETRTYIHLIQLYKVLGGGWACDLECNKS